MKFVTTTKKLKKINELWSNSTARRPLVTFMLLTTELLNKQRVTLTHTLTFTHTPSRHPYSPNNTDNHMYARMNIIT